MIHKTKCQPKTNKQKNNIIKPFSANLLVFLPACFLFLSMRYLTLSPSCSISCSSLISTLFIFNREQDAYAKESYRRAKAADSAGLFAQEIVAVSVKTRSNTILVERDEEHGRVDVSKIHAQRPAFVKDGTGTVTAGNASPISDGAAALLLMSEAKANELGVRPVARILAYADAERSPSEFTTAPALSIPLALQRANITADDVDLYEINEAFSVVALANTKLLGLDPQKVNIFGGAVSLGHPLGCSGARVLVTLLNAMQHRDVNIGTAGICNGGGGSSAIVLERVRL